MFAGRFGSGAASPEVHLALSPPFLAEGWRGTICLRAAAHRPAGSQERGVRPLLPESGMITACPWSPVPSSPPHPVSPWGQPTKGYKTRVNKRTTKFIIKRRDKGVR